MSSGIFGSIRPARITPSADAEILYTYRPTRSADSTDFNGKYKTLDPAECLVNSVTENNEVIDGVYELRLPLDKFSRKGFYTIYIRPKEIKTYISDVSVLAAYPDVKGVVINNPGVNDLTGYRIEFADGSTRIIKSCNRCQPVSVSTGDGYPKAVRYNLVDDSSSIFFCTVSPSSAPSFKPNGYPYIGVPGEEITLCNTLFTPKMIEVEMVDHDADTISYMLEGDQVRDRDNGIITTYNEDNEIYHQADYYTIKSRLGVPLYDVKKNRDVIDTSQSHDNIMDI
jgi:hypothetical protein